MASFNKVILLGNLTRDPELKYAANGTAIATFGMAVNTKSGEREDVLFIDVTAFGRQAETTSEYLKKGSAALIEGRLQLQQWESRETGEKRSKHTVVADRIQFMSASASASSAQDAPAKHDEKPTRAQTPPAGHTAAKIIAPVDEDDDIPFVSCEIEDGLSVYERRKFMA
jgi:single-strand DNA-binding protein